MSGEWVRNDRPISTWHYRVGNSILCGVRVDFGYLRGGDGKHISTQNKCTRCLGSMANLPKLEPLFRRIYQGDWSEPGKWHITDMTKNHKLTGLCGYELWASAKKDKNYQQAAEVVPEQTCLNCVRKQDSTNSDFAGYRITALRESLELAKLAVEEITKELRRLENAQTD